jgi:hypothetical protein
MVNSSTHHCALNDGWNNPHRIPMEVRCHDTARIAVNIPTVAKTSLSAF